VNAASTCNINITFTPSAAGTRNGTITITDNAAGSPQSFALTGVGGIPQVSLKPSSLTFPTQSPGTTSGTQPVQVSNLGQASLVFSRIAVSAGFQETNNCSSVAPSSNCTVSVAFTPSTSASGTVTGALTITDNASDSPQTVSLSGTAGTPGLGLAPSGSSSQTVTAGSTATYMVSIGGDGVGGTANFSCTGAPMGSQCNVPSSVTVSASSA
jgi:ASPM-SPD-2-Hydin domain-containing protein